MNLVDVGIVLIVGAGVLIGWRKGLIGPLLAEGTFLLSYWIVSTHPSLVRLVPPEVPRPLAPFVLPVVLALIIGVIGRMAFQAVFQLPLTRQVDKLVGAAVNGGVAFVIAYSILLALVSAGTVLDPLAQVASIRSPQVMAMQSLLAANPQAGMMVPGGELSQLSTVAAVRPVPLSALGQYAGVINYYEHTLRPDLKTSKLAPIVLKYGAKLPLIGHQVRLPGS
jgi:uncharacterized membrane protein required for colicin V production